MSDLVKLQIDGKTVEAPAGHAGHRRRQDDRHRDPRVLLLRRAHASGGLPHVPGRGGEVAQADDRLHAARRRGHGGAHRDAAGGPGPQVHAGVPADQPPAGLPGLRQGRRVRAAGPDLPLRRGREPLHARSSSMCRRSSGRRSSTTTRRAASCATAACASARRAWASARWASSTAGAASEIAPNMGDHLECDECGMCIDICPVGALTSGTYRYKTRPWEMKHVGTICTHCSNGCKTTLGVYRQPDHARQQPRPLRHQRRVPVRQGALRVRFREPPGAAASRR